MIRAIDVIRRPRWPVACAVIIAAQCALASNKSELKALQAELRARYVGHDLVFDHPYFNHKVIYDPQGHLISDASCLCGEESRKVTVGALKLTDHELRMDVGWRDDRDPSKLVSKHAIIVRSEKPWDRPSLLAAIDHIQHPIESSQPSQPSQPQDATAPPPGSDPRIGFLIDGQPVYRVGDGVKQPHATYSPDPEYSEEARREKVGGWTKVGAVVGSDGLVKRAWHIGISIGYGLDEKALEAVRTWRFEPAQLDGKTVASGVIAEMQFCIY
jgi:TonB family protein